MITPIISMVTACVGDAQPQIVIPAEVMTEIADVIIELSQDADLWEGKQSDDYYFSPCGFGDRTGLNNYQFNIYQQQPYGGWLAVYEVDLIGDGNKEIVWHVIPPDATHGTSLRDVYVYDTNGIFKAPYIVLHSTKSENGTIGNKTKYHNDVRSFSKFYAWDNWSMTDSGVTFTMREVCDFEKNENGETFIEAGTVCVENIVYTGEEISSTLYKVTPTDVDYQQLKSEIVENAMAAHAVENESPNEEDENITCHIVSLTDLIMSETPTWVTYNKDMSEALEEWCESHARVIEATKQYSAQQVYTKLISKEGISKNSTNGNL